MHMITLYITYPAGGEGWVGVSTQQFQIVDLLLIGYRTFDTLPRNKFCKNDKRTTAKWVIFLPTYNVHGQAKFSWLIRTRFINTFDGMIVYRIRIVR